MESQQALINRLLSKVIQALLQNSDHIDFKSKLLYHKTEIEEWVQVNFTKR